MTASFDNESITAELKSPQSVGVGVGMEVGGIAFSAPASAASVNGIIIFVLTRPLLPLSSQPSSLFTLFVVVVVVVVVVAVACPSLCLFSFTARYLLNSRLAPPRARLKHRPRHTQPASTAPSPHHHHHHHHTHHLPHNECHQDSPAGPPAPHPLPGQALDPLQFVIPRSSACASMANPGPRGRPHSPRPPSFPVQLAP
jgi:hypothetical protein